MGCLIPGFMIACSSNGYRSVAEARMTATGQRERKAKMFSLITSWQQRRCHVEETRDSSGKMMTSQGGWLAARRPESTFPEDHSVS
jgi:hypothetical protein